MTKVFRYVLSLLFAVSATPLSAATSVESDAWHVTIRTYNGVLVLRPLTDNAIRVRYAVREVGGEKSDILLDNVPGARFSVSETPQSVVVRTSGLSATGDKASGLLSFTDADGNLLVREAEGGRRVTASTVGTEACLSVADSFLLSPGEKLYGTGQFQDGELVLNGLPRHLYQDNRQIAVPFVLSSRGYGILWHNTGISELNMEGSRLTPDKVKKTGRMNAIDGWTPERGSFKTRREVVEYTYSLKVPADGRYGLLLEVANHNAVEVSLKMDGKPFLGAAEGRFVDLKAGKHTFLVSSTGGTPSLTIRTRRDAFSLASPVADAIDYVFFAGPDPDDVVASYRKVTGDAPLLPRWAYGFIQCRERYATQAELTEALAGFRSRGLPLDTIVQDWQYWGKHGWNAMQFDEKNYPDPAGMVKTVHDAHARIMISVWSKIDPTSDLGKKFAANNYYVPGTDWVDFFNPDAAEFYWQNIDKSFNSIGFDAWWLDATEPEGDILHERDVFTGPGDRVRNEYPLQVSRAVYTGQRAASPEKRVFILTRSAFSGQQRYASTVWSGDIGTSWDIFRRQITAGLGYVATGMPYWTTDCAGFFRPDNQYTSPDYHELFLRWLQFATFCPLQRVHGSGSKTELWNYGPDVEKQAWKWLYLRYRMLPYLYSTAAEVTFSGASMMRPLVMDFAGDPQALDLKGEYLFGRSLLVAPVTSPGAKTWSVYLPATPGGWYSFFAGTRLPGGSVSEVDAPIDTMPLFVKAGSILPLGPALLYSDEKAQDPVEIRVYPGADADFTLYEDDGTTYAYEKGAFSRIPMHWDDASGTLTIGERTGSFPGMPAARHFNVLRVGGGMAPIDDASVAKVLYTGERVSVTPPAQAPAE